MAYELPTAEDLALFDLLMQDVASEPDMNEAILTGPDEIPSELADELTRRTVARLDQQTGAANIERVRRIRFWLTCQGLRPLMHATQLENPSLTGDALMDVVMEELKARYR
jgi:hypothetical protein